MSFNQFRLSSEILKGLKDTKIDHPTPLQKKIFKAVQEKKDLVINSTAEEKPEIGYLLSLLNDLSRSQRKQGTRAIILTSDPERVTALDEWIWAIGYHSDTGSAKFTEEGSLKQQLNELSAGPVIIVATPGRLAELLENGKMIFREVQQMIVDRAELIDNWKQVEVISNRILGTCQRIFIAAKDSKVLRDAEKLLLKEPELVTTRKKDAVPEPETKQDTSPVLKEITQYYINVPPRAKITTLMNHLENHSSDSVVIFTASRKTADRLYKVLRKADKRAVSVHKGLEEKIFDERFERFTSGDVQNLIAGELSAGELPLEFASQVVNYDIPEEVEEYRLRADLIGSGKAARIVSLVSRQDQKDMSTISSSLGHAPEEIPLPKAVKKKITPVESEKKSPKEPKAKSAGKQKTGGKPRNKSSRKSSKPANSDTKLRQLPRPTFDQLEGGRSGKKEKKGIFGFIKGFFGGNREE
ncbi:MAG: DEAD/DEAH box helicase [Balneolaceae bacterium]|nr:MAG: DEAD/DEAH box helicase [Balneolaceae bacterium]